MSSTDVYEPDEKQLTPAALNEAEQSAGESDSSSIPEEGSDPQPSLYNSQDTGSGRFGKTKARLSKFSSNRLLVGGALAGGSGLIILILFGILILGSLKIPSLSAHIIGYEFSRVSRQMAENTSRVATEEVGVASANDSAWSKITEKYSVVRDKSYGPMVDKVNSYRPGKVYEKLQTDNRISFKYEPRQTLLNGKIKLGSRLTALVLDGKEIPVNSSAWKKLVHPVQGFSNSVEFSRTLNGSVIEALPSTNFIVRGFVARNFAKSAGLRYQWYNPKVYAGKSEAEAKVALEQESVKRITGEEPPVGSVVDKVNDATKESEKIKADCLANPECAKTLINNGGVSAEAEAAISKSFQSTLADKVVGALSPLGVLVPVCIIYDGSMDSVSAAQVIDRKSSADMRSFMAVSSAADQQKYGDVNGEGVGAMNWKIGQIEKSNAELRTSGQVVDTSRDDQPQAAATGEYTTIADSLPGPIASSIDKIAQPICPILSSFTFNAVTGALGLVAGVLSGGTSAVAEDAAAQGVRVAVTDYTKTLIKTVFSKRTFATAGATVGLTVLAQNIVHNKTAATDIALSTETNFTNASDTGANLYANQLSRQHYGRPLTCEETDALRSADTSYQTAQAASKNGFERYLALSNPDSLTTRVGSSLAGKVNSGLAITLLRNSAQIFQPVNSLLGATGLMHPQVSHALSGNCVDHQDYGVVQWGIAPDEEKAMDTDPSYRPLENQRILDGRDYCSKWSSVRGCLERSFFMDQPFIGQYNACFGYDSSGAIDSTATMGWMLARNQGGKLAPVLARDKTGNIKTTESTVHPNTHVEVFPNETITTIDSITLLTDKPYCSPGDIGINNSFVMPGPGNGPIGDLIFRYRLEKNYELTLDQLLNVQNAGDQTGSE